MDAGPQLHIPDRVSLLMQELAREAQSKPTERR